jgi:hypothetical protein
VQPVIFRGLAFLVGPRIAFGRPKYSSGARIFMAAPFRPVLGFCPLRLSDLPTSLQRFLRAMFQNKRTITLLQKFQAAFENAEDFEEKRRKEWDEIGAQETLTSESIVMNKTRDHREQIWAKWEL